MKRIVLITIGHISLALGIAGIFLPLLPTTPFLLLTSICFYHGSPRLYNWIMNHKILGTYIKYFLEDKAIPLRAKVLAILLMWTPITYYIFFTKIKIVVKCVMALVATVISIYLLSMRTLEKWEIEKRKKETEYGNK